MPRPRATTRQRHTAADVAMAVSTRAARIAAGVTDVSPRRNGAAPACWTTATTIAPPAAVWRIARARADASAVRSRRVAAEPITTAPREDQRARRPPAARRAAIGPAGGRDTPRPTRRAPDG